MSFWANIIAAASTSPLGILALLILVTSSLAIAFFSRELIAVRVIMFLLILAAFAVLAFTVLKVGQTASTTSIVPAVVGDTGCQILPDSSSRLIRPQELSALSPFQLRVARNEIYARHGRRFETQDLRNYFRGCPWYRPTSPEVTLTAIETANVLTIRQVEAGRGARPGA